MNTKLCIEFSSNKIRFLKGKFNKEFIVESFFTLLLEGESLVDSMYNEEILGQMIKNELISKKIKGTGVSFIISDMPNMLVREINVPRVNKDDTYRIVKQEAQKHFPINIDNYVIDYKIVDYFQEEGMKKQKLIVLAVPKFLIERLIGIAEAADLKLEKIDVEANTLSKVLYKYQSQTGYVSNAPSLICSIENTYITMVVVKKGAIQMSKTTSYDGILGQIDNNAFQEVASTNEIDFNYSSQIEGTADEILVELSDNIVRYINFYTSNSKQREEVENIYITGEISDKLNIIDVIKSRVEANVKKFDDLTVKVIDSAYQDQDISEYKNVLGGLLK